MREFSMHQLLDVAELMIEEGLDAKQLAAFRRSLYRPEPGQTEVAGFDAREEMSGFNALRARFAAGKK